MFTCLCCPLQLYIISFLVILQQRVAELELQYSHLEKENTEVQKNLKDCHVLLVSANIDPGEYVSPFS